jgi:hypothetical protein
MAELMDISGWGGETVNTIIEYLDQNRLIEREGFVGGKFWTFAITEKGGKELPVLSVEEAKAVKLGLWPSDISALKALSNTGDTAVSEYIHTNITDAEQRHSVSASLLKLLRKGYLDEFGFARRKIRLNAKGKSLLTDFA